MSDERRFSAKSFEAPGKIILVGEHAVVYGRPAIAAPVWNATATATISEEPALKRLTLHAHDIGQTIEIDSDSPTDPLATVVRLTLMHLGYATPPARWRIDLRSSIPIAGGLGSGAAVSSALIQALFAQAERKLDRKTLSQLIFEGEKIYHGQPSGIDNTVIAYGLPVWYVKESTPLPFALDKKLRILIGNSGVAAPTKEAVADVRRAWQRDPQRYERIFTEIGAVATATRVALHSGNLAQLGTLFNRNQRLLRELDVSHPRLEQLIGAAVDAGAFGAKLSGGGRGGNVIALVDRDRQAPVRAALRAAGAQPVIETSI